MAMSLILLTLLSSVGLIFSSASAPKSETFVAVSTSATTGWIQVKDAASLRAYPNLRETAWEKNVSTTSSSQYDKICLHRLVKANTASKGVVFMVPGLYGNGERLVSDAPTGNFVLTETMSSCIYWANRDFDVYTMDYRTHFVPQNLNASQLSFMLDWSLDAMINDIKESVEKAKEVSGSSKVFMAGMSMGGTWVQFYASKYWQQDLRGLILLDPGPSKSTPSKNAVLTNSANLTKIITSVKLYGNWSWETPQTSYTPSPLNPGYVFLTQYAAQNPSALATWPNGTLLTPTVNPSTNKTWASISEWFEYRSNSTPAGSNTIEGYGNNTINIAAAARNDRYFTIRPFLDSAVMLDWTISPYTPFDFFAHINEIDVPVLAFRSGLNLAAYGPITNGMATADFTVKLLPKYGHTDVFMGTYSARDVSQPALEWMTSKYQSLAASTFSSVTVFVGQTWYFCVHSNGGLSPHKYQWYEGNSPIVGQTNMVLAASKPSAGTYTYYCKVTDAEGATTNSSPITLTVR